jgi:hypothetical protein
VLNSRFGLPEGLARAFGRGKSVVCHAGFNYQFWPVWERRIFFKKPLASGRVFDIFTTPFRPKD